MILNLLKIFFLSLIVIPSAFSQYEITFEASLDARKVEVGSFVEVHFTLTNAKGSELKPPQFKGFDIVSGPNRLFQTKGVNGVYTRTANYSYTLRANKEGKYTFSAASVKAHGRLFKTNPISIEVVKKGDLNPSQQIDDVSDFSFFIRAEINKDSIYPGEQLILDYKLYTLVDVDRFDIQRESTYDGFYMRPMGLYNKRAEKTEVNGVSYFSKSLRKVALYPQQSGTYEIDPIWMKLGIPDPNNTGTRRGFFFINKLTYKDVTSNELSITVLPAPSDQPPGFSLSFGKFSGITSMSQTTASTDDAISLRIKIMGNGDPNRLNPPEIDPEGRFQVFDPTILEDTKREHLGEIYVRKEWEYILIPKEPGQFNFIPAYIYYDTDSSQFYNAFSDTFNLTISSGTASSANPLNFDESNQHQASMSPISPDLNITTGGLALTTRWWYWILYCIPILPFFLAVQKERKRLRIAGVDAKTKRKNKAKELANSKLKHAESALLAIDSKGFYAAISTALKGYVADKLNLGEIDMNKSAIKQTLTTYELDENHIDQFLKILTICDAALYSPSTSEEKMKTVYTQSESLIVALEEKI